MLKLNVVKEEINQSWTIERIAKEFPPRTWESVFKDAEPELEHISLILEQQEKAYGMFYPMKKDIFAAFNYTPLQNVKVVIVGQDPYPQTISIPKSDGTIVSGPRAVGLSFSVRQGDSIPSSLQNIYKEIKNNIRTFETPDHGDLREWTRQGVLLLNMSLTLQPGAPGSHGDVWLGFVNKVFKALALVNPQCIFLLWGKEAQKVKPMLGDRSVVLEAAHPSGFSATRGFFGCNHFNLVNEHLLKQKKACINWHLSTLAELNESPKKVVNTNKVFSSINVDSLPVLLNSKN